MNGRKVIGIGETVFDIIFGQDNKPRSGNPGGSVYNALISLGRCGVHSVFVSEIGDDNVGSIIRQFLINNGVSDECLYEHKGMKSPLSLAFLDENSDAHYTFYKDYQNQRFELSMPHINSGDIVIFGSYFALNPVIRPAVLSFLHNAKNAGAMLYYDVNFRQSHQHELPQLMPTITENFALADIVKGSDEDFRIMFGTSDWRSAYHKYIEPHCATFICTQAANGATAMHHDDEISVPAVNIRPVSTVGAGDNFNAGTIYGLCQNNIGKSQLSNMQALQCAMAEGIRFATEVCLSLDNYIAPRN